MNHLPIALIADRNFLLPTAVAITSLLENKAETSEYVVYAACVGFSGEQIDVLRKIEAKYHTKINVIEIDEEKLRQKYSALSAHDCNATISALVKFDLPDICAAEKTLLYMDGDVIVKGDLSYFTSLSLDETVYAAVVRDSGVLYTNRASRGNQTYFNSGVMYLNLEAMRRDGVPQKLVEAKMRTTDRTLMDQNVLNEVFGPHKMFIDYRYNTLYVNLRRAHYYHSLKLEDVNDFCGQQYEKWEDILTQALIVHYSSFDKPWKYEDVNGVELWDEYYRKSLVFSGKLPRKRLHTKNVEALLAHRGTRPLGILIWELETKGFGRCVSSVLRMIKSGI
jgi:lipopolysaccharide biosynthesis glycosyltransferase